MFDTLHQGNPDLFNRMLDAYDECGSVELESEDDIEFDMTEDELEF